SSCCLRGSKLRGGCPAGAASGGDRWSGSRRRPAAVEATTGPRGGCGSVPVRGDSNKPKPALSSWFTSPQPARRCNRTGIPDSKFQIPNPKDILIWNLESVDSNEIPDPKLKQYSHLESGIRNLLTRTRFHILNSRDILIWNRESGIW